MAILVPAARLESSRAAWLDLLVQSDGAHVQMHPDVAVEQDALVYARWSGSRENMTAIGVLPSKTFVTSHWPVLRQIARLRGRRLAGDRLIGEDDAEAAREFATAVRELLVRDADHVLIEDLEVGSSLDQAIRDGAARGDFTARRIQPPQPHWWIRFPPRPGDYWQRFKRKARYNLSRRVKQLEHEVLRVTGPEQIDPFLTDAELISSKSWQSRRLGLRIRNDTHRRRALERFAELGALRSYLLKRDDCPIAFAYATQLGRCFVYEEIGYDQAYADAGPGEVLLYRIIEDLIRERCPVVFDFGHGDAIYKQKFANHRTESGPMLLASRRLRPAVALAVGETIRRLDATGRALLRSTGLYDRMRRLYHSA